MRSSAPALRFGCPLIDHHRRFTLALVNRTRPAENSHELQAIELGRSVMALRFGLLFFLIRFTI
jgi:hypothetical protein